MGLPKKKKSKKLKENRSKGKRKKKEVRGWVVLLGSGWLGVGQGPNGVLAALPGPAENLPGWCPESWA